MQLDKWSVQIGLLQLPIGPGGSSSCCVRGRVCVVGVGWCYRSFSSLFTAMGKKVFYSISAGSQNSESLISWPFGGDGWSGPSLGVGARSQ